MNSLSYDKMTTNYCAAIKRELHHTTVGQYPCMGGYGAQSNLTGR